MDGSTGLAGPEIARPLFATGPSLVEVTRVVRNNCKYEEEQFGRNITFVIEN